MERKMKNLRIDSVLLGYLVTIMLLSSCAPALPADPMPQIEIGHSFRLYNNTAYWWMNEVMKQTKAGQIFLSPNFRTFLIRWHFPGSVTHGFAFVNTHTNTVRAGIANANDVQRLVKLAQDYGWQPINVKELAITPFAKHVAEYAKGVSSAASTTFSGAAVLFDEWFELVKSGEDL